MTTLQELKTSTNLQALFTDLSTYSKHAENKQVQISNLTGNNKRLGELDWGKKEQVRNLNTEIEELYRQKIIPCKEKISQLNPY
jgi:hypothetical protein